MENKALFLDESLNEIGNKKFDSTDEFITFKKGTFNIRLDAYLYRNKNTAYYAYIYPTDEKLLIDIKVEPIKEKGNDKNIYSPRLTKLKEKLEHGDLKLIVGESIIGQLAHIAVMGLKTNWVMLVIIAVVVSIGAGGAMYAIGLNNGISQGFAQAQHIINSTVSYPMLSPSITPHPSPIIVG